jgi:PAS domain-containing protein
MQTFLQTFPQPVLVVDSALQIVAYSQRVLSIFGIRTRGVDSDPAEQLGAAVGEDVELDSNIALATARLVRPGDEEHFGWHHRERIYEIRICASEGEEDTFLVFFEDITHRSMSEKIQLDARHYLEHILGNIPLGVVVLDRDLRITSMNRREIEFCKHFGRTLTLVDAIGSTLAALLPDGAGGEWHELCHKVVESGEISDELKQTFGEGEDLLVLDTVVTPLLDDRGELAGVIMVSDDVTRQTQLENELVRVEKLATVGQMVITINHEINNPLNIISNNAQMLRLLNPNLEEKIVAKLHTIEEQVKRIAEVTERLRLLDQVETDEYIAEGPQMIDVWKKDAPEE